MDGQGPVTEEAAGASKPYRKRKGEGHERREEILAAARSVFVAEGYEHATIRKIAAKAGVSSTALYLYFPDKDAILLEICDKAFGKLVARFEAIRNDGGTPLDRLRRLMEAYLRFGLAHPDEYRLIFMTKQAIPMPFDHRTGAEMPPGTPGTNGAKAFAGLRDLVAALIQDGTLKGEDPNLVAEVIWAGGHGLVSLLITMPSFHWSPVDQLIPAMIDAQLNGVVRRRG